MKCARKTRHDTRQDAEAAILRILECNPPQPGDERLRAYQCADCSGGWHVGRRQDRRPHGGRVTLAMLATLRRPRPAKGVRPS